VAAFAPGGSALREGLRDASAPNALAASAKPPTRLAVLFYATDDGTAEEDDRAADPRGRGFEPWKAGGAGAAGRIEAPGG